MPTPLPRSNPVASTLLRALRGLLALLPLFGLSACNRDAPDVVSKIWQRVDGRWTYEGQAFETADAATLVALDSRFARDSVQGYYRGTPIPGSHGPSLEVLGKNEVRDHQAVYWADTYRKGQEYYMIRHNRVETITGANPARYQVLKWGYAKDGSHAYREGQRLKGVRDPASFEALTPRLSRDMRRAYFEDVEIPDSDGASFQIIDVHDDAWVRDHQRAWHVSSGQPEAGEPARREVQLLKKVQPAALRPLGRQYASDGQHVWWRGRLLQDAQAATFAVIDQEAASSPAKSDARDASGLFERGRRLPTQQP
jgi:hypothetical protein